jgi:hypothetical protein
MLNLHIVREKNKGNKKMSVSQLFINCLKRRMGVTFIDHKTTGDGNCFFHAISCAVVPALAENYSSNRFANQMREMFVKFLQIGNVKGIILSTESCVRTVQGHNDEKNEMIESIKNYFSFMQLSLVDVFCKFMHKNFLIVMNGNQNEINPFKSYVLNLSFEYIILLWNNTSEHVSVFYVNSTDPEGNTKKKFFFTKGIVYVFTLTDHPTVLSCVLAELDNLLMNYYFDLNINLPVEWK